jgi:hypothetical protein
MPEVHIERLTLKLVGGDRTAGKRLAEQVAAVLERMPLAAELPERVETLCVDVRAVAGPGTARLAERITAELVRQLRRS